jgi:SOS-response transcriptional repressor LexA
MVRTLTATLSKMTYMETIGHKIKKLRKALNLTQKEVADRLGIKPSSVTQWENDITEPSGKNLLGLAGILNTPPENLIGATSVREQSAVYLVDKTKINLRRIPVISSVQAGSWREAVDNFHPGDAESWQETTANVSAKAFALKVEGRSMQNPYGNPSIPNGSIVIVDPELLATNGKIVVAKLPNTDETVIKKLIIDGNNSYLESLNPDYKPILINSECIIVGVVKQVIQDI